MTRKRILALLLTVCLTAALFTACTGGSTGSTGGTAAPAASSSGGAAAPAASSGGAAAPAATPGKDTVVVACAAEPDVFVPFHTTNGSNMDEVPILHNVYETPIKLTPDSKHEPLLATSWDVSSDGLVYTLHIRDDVYFHNGDKMTAEDVAYSIRVPAGMPAGQAQLANVSTVEAPDDTTVVITLTAPYAPFLNALCGRYALVVNSKLYEEIGEDAYNEAPIGTGPYKFVSRTSGDRVVLESDEKYWGGAPAIKNVIYRVMTDANTQMISLENGDIDVLIRANVGNLTKLTTDKVKWEAVDASSICAMSFNCAKGPTADIKFRQALQYGINKEEINIGVWEGYATVGTLQMLPSFSGAPDAGSYKVIDYDQEKAKQLLAESSYNGEEFSILTVSGTLNESAAQIIQGQLIELGINCTVNSVDAPSQTALNDAGDYGANIRASGVSVIDADGLYFQYHTTQIQKPGVAEKGIATPEMDALLEEGRVEVDEAKRKEIYKTISDMIVDNAYATTLYYEANACAWNSGMSGVQPRVLTGLYYFNDWSWN